MRSVIVFAGAAINIFAATGFDNPQWIISLNYATAVFCFGTGIAIAINENIR